MDTCKQFNEDMAVESLHSVDFSVEDIGQASKSNDGEILESDYQMAEVENCVTPPSVSENAPLQ